MKIFLLVQGGYMKWNILIILCMVYFFSCAETIQVVKEKAESEEGQKLIETVKEKAQDKQTQEKLKGLLGNKKEKKPYSKE